MGITIAVNVPSITIINFLDFFLLNPQLSQDNRNSHSESDYVHPSNGQVSTTNVAMNITTAVNVPSVTKIQRFFLKLNLT